MALAALVALIAAIITAIVMVQNGVFISMNAAGQLQFRPRANNNHAQNDENAGAKLWDMLEI